jgi:hypothetical protein
MSKCPAESAVQKLGLGDMNEETLGGERGIQNKCTRDAPALQVCGRVNERGGNI